MPFVRLQRFASAVNEIVVEENGEGDGGGDEDD